MEIYSLIKKTSVYSVWIFFQACQAVPLCSLNVIFPLLSIASCLALLFPLPNWIKLPEVDVVGAPVVVAWKEATLKAILAAKFISESSLPSVLEVNLILDIYSRYCIISRL